MAGADKQALDAVFKEVYEEGVSEGVNNKNPLRDVIKSSLLWRPGQCPGVQVSIKYN